jgi:hypothetical protein
MVSRARNTTLAVLAWSVGVFLGLGALGGLAQGSPAAVPIAIAALIVIPPAGAMLKKKSGRDRPLARVGIVIALFLTAGLIVEITRPSSAGAAIVQNTTPLLGDDSSASSANNTSPSLPNDSAEPQDSHGPLDGRQLRDENVTFRAIPFDDLMRYSDEYRGSYVTYRGEVWQVLGGDNGSGAFELRVAITTDGLAWRNAVLVDYVGHRVLQNDIVNFSGRYDGLETYDVVGGGSATAPRIVDASVSVLVKAGDQRG